MARDAWKILGKKLIYQKKPFIKVEERRVRLPNGDQRSFYLNRSYEVVMMAALTIDKKFLLIKEYFPAHGKYLIAVTGGIIEKNEINNLASAKRELLEETGYRAKKWVSLGSSVRGKYTTNTIHHYVALDAEWIQKPCLEPGEAGTEAVLLEPKKVIKMLKTRKFEDMFSEVCLRRAVSYLQDHKII